MAAMVVTITVVKAIEDGDNNSGNDTIMMVMITLAAMVVIRMATILMKIVTLLTLIVKRHTMVMSSMCPFLQLLRAL